MAVVQDPLALRALEAWGANHHPAPLKIKIPEDWLSDFGMYIEAPSADKLLPGPGAGKSRRPRRANKATMTAPRQGGSGAVCGHGNSFGVVKPGMDAGSQLHTVPLPAAMKTMCTSCGVYLQEGHKFCVFCGSPVKKVVASGTKAGGVVMHQNGATRSASGDGGKSTVIRTKRANVPASLLDNSLAPGQQMEPRVRSTSKNPFRRTHISSLTSLAEEEEEEEEAMEVEKEELGMEDEYA